MGGVRGTCGGSEQGVHSCVLKQGSEILRGSPARALAESIHKLWEVYEGEEERKEVEGRVGGYRMIS